MYHFDQFSESLREPACLPPLVDDFVRPITASPEHAWSGLPKATAYSRCVGPDRGGRYLNLLSSAPCRIPFRSRGFTVTRRKMAPQRAMVRNRARNCGILEAQPRFRELVLS